MKKLFLFFNLIFSKSIREDISNDSLLQKINILEDKVIRLTSALEIMNTKYPDNNIHFMATISNNLDRGTGTVVFDEVLAENGGGYNKYTGAYTVMVEGLYVFTVNMLTLKNDYTGIQIDIDGVKACRAFGRSFNDAASCTVVKYLKRGRTVDVTWTRNGSDWEDHGGLFADKNTNFLGFKLN